MIVSSIIELSRTIVILHNLLGNFVLILNHIYKNKFIIELFLNVSQ